MIEDPNFRLPARLRNPELRLGGGLGLPAGGSAGGNPAASFDFLSGETLDSRVTFTRASSATRINASGALELVGTNAPRFDYDPVTLAPRGLLIEEPRSNLLLNSLLSGAALSTQGVTVSAQPYTLSFYGTGSVTLSGAHSATLNGAGGYPSRVTLTFTPSAGTLTVTVTGSVQYAQLEVGSFATSFIPTAGAIVSRGADIAIILDIDGWINPVAGSVLAIVDIIGEGLSNNTIFDFDDNTLNNRMGIFAFPTKILNATVQVGGINYVNSNTGNVMELSVPFKAAFSYSSNRFSVVMDGGEVVTDTSVIVPTVAQMRLGHLVTFLNGHFLKFQYFNRQFSSEKLREITA